MGGKKSGRPGGNPNIAKHGFKIQGDRDEPLTEAIGFRLPKSLKQRFDQLSKEQKTAVRLAGIDAMKEAVTKIESEETEGERE